MFNIDKYLEKFSKNIKSFELEKEKVIEIIKKYINITLNKEAIEIKDYTVKISASPAIKNKIFTYKKSIMDDLTAEKMIVKDIL